MWDSCSCKVKIFLSNKNISVILDLNNGFVSWICLWHGHLGDASKWEMWVLSVVEEVLPVAAWFPTEVETRKATAVGNVYVAKGKLQPTPGGVWLCSQLRLLGATHVAELHLSGGPCPEGYGEFELSLARHKDGPSVLGWGIPEYEPWGGGSGCSQTWYPVTAKMEQVDLRGTWHPGLEVLGRGSDS